jgi:hypothetical protein
MPEAFVGCALAAFGEQLSSKEGVPMGRVHEQTRFMVNLLRNEYYLSYSMESDEFGRVVREMEENQIVELREGKLRTHPQGLRMVAFYCSLLRAHIDCYWATMVYVLSIARTQDHRH